MKLTQDKDVLALDFAFIDKYAGSIAQETGMKKQKVKDILSKLSYKKVKWGKHKYAVLYKEDIEKLEKQLCIHKNQK